MDYVALCIMCRLGDQVYNIMEKYRIGDLHNMGTRMEYKTNIKVTLPGQHEDLYGQAISYNTLANH